jgi:hypothetical protein
MWAIFLQYADKPDQKSLIESIAKKKGEIKMALQALIEVSQDEHERARNLSRRKYQTDLESNMAAVRENTILEVNNEWKAVVEEKNMELKAKDNEWKAVVKEKDNELKAVVKEKDNELKAVIKEKDNLIATLKAELARMVK